MQSYPKATPSVYPCGIDTPICEHTYLRQSKYPFIPPLYIETKLRGPKTSSLPFQTMSYLQQSLEFLGYMKPRSAFIGRDINTLRTELDGGMSRDKREQMQIFVAGLEDKRQRRAAEVYLARYPGFVLDGEGKLDYGVGDRLVIKRDEAFARVDWCTVM
jgi:hypothetical protein